MKTWNNNAAGEILVKTYSGNLQEITNRHNIKFGETDAQAIERIVKLYSDTLIRGAIRIGFYLTVNGQSINWREARPDLSAKLDSATKRK